MTLETHQAVGVLLVEHHSTMLPSGYGRLRRRVLRFRVVSDHVTDGFKPDRRVDVRAGRLLEHIRPLFTLVVRPGSTALPVISCQGPAFARCWSIHAGSY